MKIIINISCVYVLMLYNKKININKCKCIIDN